MTGYLMPSSGRESPSNQMIPTKKFRVWEDIQFVIPEQKKSRTERNQVENLFELINKFFSLYSKTFYIFVLTGNSIQHAGA